ncbi:MAG: hypothetical protein AAFR82_08605 [Pseudomonadota bacterium]
MIRTILSLFGAVALAACQHGSGPVPAILENDSAETMAALKSSLAPAMDRAQIEFGAGDPTATSSVSVLPAQATDFETNSPAMPVIFKLFIQDGRCFAVREGSDSEIALPDVPCRPA